MNNRELFNELTKADAAIEVGMDMSKQIIETTNNAEHIYAILLMVAKNEYEFHKKVCEYLVESAKEEEKE